jgi:hypothetical protein
MSKRLPEPRLTKILHLEASLGEALDVGNVAQGRRRIIPLTGGTFAGPELNGTLLPGPAPTGRSFSQTAQRSATSAAHCKRITVTCSISARKQCATATARFSPA